MSDDKKPAEAAETEPAEAEAPAATPAEAPAPPAPKPPFALKVGKKISLGPRQGKIKVLRGAGSEPYEVKIAWEKSKYPEWHLYKTLELHYASDHLRIL